ncbi:MAG: protein kinase, partial [Pyrinomonadaceae bacterium]
MNVIGGHREAGGRLESRAIEIMAETLANHHDNDLVGKSLGNYQVIEMLGAGGMGRVYMARDTLLGRKVALKLLPAYFTQDRERVRRFQQEARAASALNHPNILTIYEIRHVDSIHYIATEFIEGETLRERIGR